MQKKMIKGKRLENATNGKGHQNGSFNFAEAVESLRLVGIAFQDSVD